MNSICHDEIAYDEPRTYLALKATVLRICGKVTNGELSTCTKVKEYIRTVSDQQMAESLDENFSAFLNGLRNNFEGVEYV